MPEIDIVLVAIMVMAGLAIGLMAYVIAMPFFSGERRTDQRVKSVQKGRAPKKGGAANSGDLMAQRRKDVQDTLRDMEERQKSREKVTTRIRLLRAGFDAQPSMFFMVSLIFGVACAGITYLLLPNIYMAGAVLFIAAFGFPRWVLGFLARRRQKKFVDELANAMDVIVRGVKSGLPLNDCLKIIATESPEPLRTEFSELVEQQRVGVQLAEAFERMYERMPVQEVTYFGIVIAIQQQAGGNLAEALGNLSAVLRDRKKLAAKVQALSSEAKTGAIIIGSLPVVVCAALSFLNPTYIAPLFTTTIGHIMLVGSAMLMALGIFVMKKMINFDF